MTRPWLDDGDVRLYHGDALMVVAGLPAKSVQTVVTSPPYWGLRDYGNGNQIGLEASPETYIERLVEVFNYVRAALRDDGTVWVNLGDSYAQTEQRHRHDKGPAEWGTRGGERVGGASTAVGGLKPKDLCGIPWRVAFALQADGWYLRSDIIWAKPNPMPESVTDRPTKAHEYVFLLSKSARYYYDADAIREASQASPESQKRAEYGRYEGTKQRGGSFGVKPDYLNVADGHYDAVGRNARSVWSIATQPTAEAHFATFPEELVRRCVLAGSSEAGECSACGTPWTRQVERGELVGKDRGGNYKGREAEADAGMVNRFASQNEYRPGMSYERVDRGWVASCACGVPARPQTVLDPFVGSGTTALVARRHGRRAIGIDLSLPYLEIAAKRTAQLSLLAEGPAA